MREMESNGEQTHFTKRVTLPSGKTIEVVYFAEDPRVGEPHDARASPCRAGSGSPRLRRM